MLKAIAIYAIMLFIGYVAGNLVCMFRDVRIEPSSEISYKLYPKHSKIVKCITQCSDKW